MKTETEIIIMSKAALNTMYLRFKITHNQSLEYSIEIVYFKI